MQDNLQRILSEFALAGVQFELEENITINKVSAEEVKDHPGASRHPCAGGELPLIIPKAEPVGRGALLALAEAACGACASMDELIAAIKSFDRQPTAKMAKNIVPPMVAGESFSPLRQTRSEFVSPFAGKTNMDILVITDAPGKDDDEAGRLMSGAAGEMFSKMLGAIDLGMDAVSVFPVMFHKLPGDRTPASDELAITKVFFDKFVEFARPKAILSLGQTAFSFAAPDGGTLVKARGKVHDALGAKLVPTYGLKFLMAKPEHKKDAWADLQKFKELFGQKI
ncbi:MAG: uracil-DNA glycosylase [Rickettsiales bacterium]|jgi:DNA polymerase|nr:uracil-DNA glycosylase [Rickettsiales bacterium]